MCPAWNSQPHSRMRLHYPEQELHLAREEFKRRWSSAVVRDESAYYVQNSHLNYPPNVRMLNCRDYPFEQDNKIYQMPCVISACTSFRGQKRKLEPVHPKHRFSTACSKMTENSLTLPPDNASLDLANNGSVFYVCDHCPFRSPSEELALSHLKSKQHVSCSEYLNSTCGGGGGDNNDSDGNSRTQVSTILRTPRNLYNAEGSMPGWAVGDSAVFCPTCYLLLPDKLLCAYHHYSQHPGHLPKFAYGTVLESRDFLVSMHRTKCSQCKRKFSNHDLLLQHWFGPHSTCRSPFHPSESQSNGYMAQVVDVYCDLCRVHFDRLPPTGPKHKPTNPSPSSLRHWSEGFCKFCLNHVQNHWNQMPKSREFACRLRLRFVHLDRHQTQNLSAYVYLNDSTLILRFLRECKLLVSYLKFCHGSRRSLVKQAKLELDRLIRQSEVCVT